MQPLTLKDILYDEKTRERLKIKYVIVGDTEILIFVDAFTPENLELDGKYIDGKKITVHEITLPR